MHIYIVYTNNSYGIIHSRFVTHLPFAGGYRYKNEEMQGAYLAQTWHRVLLVVHGTDLLI